jgi:hypothetical protein
LSQEVSPRRASLSSVMNLLIAFYCVHHNKKPLLLTPVGKEERQPTSCVTCMRDNGQSRVGFTTPSSSISKGLRYIAVTAELRRGTRGVVRGAVDPRVDLTGCLWVFDHIGHVHIPIRSKAINPAAGVTGVASPCRNCKVNTARLYNIEGPCMEYRQSHISRPAATPLYPFEPLLPLVSCCLISSARGTPTSVIYRPLLLN